MQSEIMKKIRFLDKDMRDKFVGFPLFQVSFKLLKNTDQLTQEFVLEWYESLGDVVCYRDFYNAWRQSDPGVWDRLRSNASHLPEYENLLYLKSIFVMYCKNTMPEIIVYKDPRR